MNLKIKNKISLIFIFIIAIEGILFAVAYKGMENITSIKESQSNMILVLVYFNCYYNSFRFITNKFNL